MLHLVMTLTICITLHGSTDAQNIHISSLKEKTSPKDLLSYLFSVEDCILIKHALAISKTSSLQDLSSAMAMRQIDSIYVQKRTLSNQFNFLTSQKASRENQSRKDQIEMSQGCLEMASFSQ